MRTPSVTKQSIYRLCQTKPCSIPGFECYVSDALEAPPAVMTHLCKEKRINTVPIFSDDTRAEVVERGGFKRYFIGKRQHFVRDNSRYGMKNSNTVEDCSEDRTPHVTCVSDDDELRRLEEEAEETEREMQSLTAKLKESAEKLRRANERCRQSFAELERVRGRIAQRSKLQSDIKERQISKDSLASGDAQQLRAHLVEQMRNNTKELVRAAQQEREHVKRHQELNVKIGLLMKKISQVESQNADKVSQRDAAKAELDEKTAELDHQAAKVKRMTDDLGNMLKR